MPINTSFNNVVLNSDAIWRKLINNNMVDMSIIALHYVFKVMLTFTVTSVKKRLWQLLLRCETILQQFALFISCKTWNFCSGKPCFEAPPKQHSSPNSDY